METPSMKSLLLILAIVGCTVPRTVAAPPTTITIDKDSFSDIYPAVWFDPNKGTVYRITEESEKPPVAGAVVWIEPSDPEFAVGQEVKEEVGMCVIGYGEEVFANPELASMIARRMEKTERVERTALELGRRPVVVVVTPTGSSMVIFDKVDPESDTMELRWLPLKPGGTPAPVTPPVAPPTTPPTTAKGPEKAPPQPPPSKKRSPVPKPPPAKVPDYSAYTVVHGDHPHDILKVKNGLFVYKKQNYTPVRDGKKHGVETEWKLKGDPPVRDHITRTTTYKGGERHGELREYYPNGMLRELWNYVDGKLQGMVQEFYESGALKEMYNVKDGQKHGLYEMYWESGPIMKEAMYFEGKLDDFERQYREDGLLLKHTGYTTGGKLHGDYREYNKYNGTLEYRAMYNNGIIVWRKQYYKNGALGRHTLYDPKGKRSGLDIEYFANGKVSTMTRYENDEEVSRREFDIEGKPMEE